MKDFDWTVQWPHEEYGTLVLTTDGSAEVIGDQTWTISDLLSSTRYQLVVDARGRQGGCSYLTTDIDPAVHQLRIDRYCDWETEKANGNVSIEKAIQETGDFALNQTIIGTLMSGMGSIRAGSRLVDRFRFAQHDWDENRFLQLNRLQRAKSVGNILVFGHNTRHPDVSGLPHPFESSNPASRPETYTVTVNLPGIFRTPAFSLPLLKEKLTYDLMSRQAHPIDRKFVKGVIRLVNSMPKRQGEKAWAALDRALQNF